MGARRRLLKELLSNVKYIKNLSEQQIKASLWNGEASLYDLELEPKALNELFHDGLPGGFEILSVTVKELHICIPWNRILTNSTRIVAHDVEVRVSVHCEDEAQWRALFAARQRAFLRKHQERAQSGPYSLAPGASGTFDSLKQRIVDGMQVQVSRASTIVVSSHPRHFPFHGEQPQEQLQSLVEVLRVDGEDIMMSPADPAKVPCDKLKSMATFVSGDKLVSISKYAKCNSFKVIPGEAMQCGCEHAAKEFMSNPAVLSCHITTRYVSDGSRICPFPISLQLDWEFHSSVNLRVCECQLRAVTATAMDTSKWEAYRISKSVLIDEQPGGQLAGSMSKCDQLLLNTSKVARSFAKGPEGRTASTSAAASSLWGMIWQQKKDVQPGFHALPIQGIDQVAPYPMPSLASPSDGKGGYRDRTMSVGSLSEVSRHASDTTAGAHNDVVGPEADVLESRQCSGQEVVVRKVDSVESFADAEESEDLHEQAEQPTEGQARDDAEDDEDEDDEGFWDAQDYFSAAGESVESLQTVVSSGHGAKWMKPIMRWFGSAQKFLKPQVADFPEITHISKRMSVSCASPVTLHVSIHHEDEDTESEGPALTVAEVMVEGGFWESEVQTSLTNVQVDCLRRLADRTDERPAVVAEALQLPLLLHVSQSMSWPCASIKVTDGDGEVELLQSTGPVLNTVMVSFAWNPREGPPRLVHSPNGVLRTWPLEVRLHGVRFLADHPRWTRIRRCHERCKPYFNSKLPAPPLLPPEECGNGGNASALVASGRCFPVEFVVAELTSCEVLEPETVAVMHKEKRWPIHVTIPHLIVRGQSDLWDLSQLLAQPELGQPELQPHMNGKPMYSEGDDGTVTIPKEMFAQLVDKAARATRLG